MIDLDFRNKVWDVKISTRKELRINIQKIPDRNVKIQTRKEYKVILQDNK